MRSVRDTQQPVRSSEPGKNARSKGTPVLTLARENQLALLIKEGNEEALAEVYDRFLLPMYSYFYGQIGKEVDAEDLTSATFFQALQGLRAGVTFTSGCASWLFGIASTVLQATQGGTAPASPFVLSTAELEELGQCVLAEMQAREQTYMIWHLVERLPPDFQQVLRLRYKYALSYGEIALQMKLTVTQCKTMHGRAMKKLRDIVSKEYGKAFSVTELSSLKAR